MLNRQARRGLRDAHAVKGAPHGRPVLQPLERERDVGVDQDQHERHAGREHQRSDRFAHGRPVPDVSPRNRGPRLLQHTLIEHHDVVVRPPGDLQAIGPEQQLEHFPGSGCVEGRAGKSQAKRRAYHGALAQIESRQVPIGHTPLPEGASANQIPVAAAIAPRRERRRQQARDRGLPGSGKSGELHDQRPSGDRRHVGGADWFRWFRNHTRSQMASLICRRTSPSG